MYILELVDGVDLDNFLLLLLEQVDVLVHQRGGLQFDFLDLAHAEIGALPEILQAMVDALQALGKVLLISGAYIELQLIIHKLLILDDLRFCVVAVVLELDHLFVQHFEVLLQIFGLIDFLRGHVAQVLC